MSSSLGSEAVVRATAALSATAKSLAAGVFALTLILSSATAFAQDVAPQRPSLQRHSLLNPSKQMKAPQSYVIKAACPSFSACCCVIGGYSACMTGNECSALGGSCTGRC